ncbi:MAG: hypothetical protein CMH60_05850 [Myxococcales bacterium]|nr:hypothetical protein [Myxococcales bacterium]
MSKTTGFSNYNQFVRDFVRSPVGPCNSVVEDIADELYQSDYEDSSSSGELEGGLWDVVVDD